VRNAIRPHPRRTRRAVDVRMGYTSSSLRSSRTTVRRCAEAERRPTASYLLLVAIPLPRLPRRFVPTLRAPQSRGWHHRWSGVGILASKRACLKRPWQKPAHEIPSGCGEVRHPFLLPQHGFRRADDPRPGPSAPGRPTARSPVRPPTVVRSGAPGAVKGPNAPHLAARLSDWPRQTR
jgi:hypothetical protein